MSDKKKGIGTFENVLQEVIKDKGGDKNKFLQLLNEIKYHESAGTMDPQIQQYGGGPGRGLYQFEGLGGSNRILSSANRTRRYLNEKGYDVPDFIMNIINAGTGDASQLTEEQQDMLALGDLRMKGGLDLGDYVNGNLSIEDVWVDHWWIGNPQTRDEQRPKRLESFRKSSEKFRGRNFTEVPEQEATALASVDVDTGTVEAEPVAQPAEPQAQPTFTPAPISMRGGALTPGVEEQVMKERELRQPTSEPGYTAPISAFSSDFKLLNKEMKMGGRINAFNEGGTHEENPHGGIPLSMNDSGGMNLVEEGETMYNDYIFSNSLMLDDKTAQELNIDEKYVGETLADISKDYKAMEEERPYDRILKGTVSRELDKLMLANERLKPSEPSSTDSSFLFGGELGAIDLIGGLGNIAGMATSFIPEGGASDAIGGALSGAQAGLMLGPVGAGIGAAVGGITSLIGGNKRRKELDKKQHENTLKTSAQFRESDFKYGGKMKKYKDGGDPKKKRRISTERFQAMPKEGIENYESKLKAWGNRMKMDNKTLKAFVDQRTSDKAWMKQRDDHLANEFKAWRAKTTNNKPNFEFSQSSREYRDFMNTTKSNWLAANPRPINEGVKAYQNRMNTGGDSTDPRKKQHTAMMGLLPGTDRIPWIMDVNEFTNLDGPSANITRPNLQQFFATPALPDIFPQTRGLNELSVDAPITGRGMPATNQSGLMQAAGLAADPNISTSGLGNAPQSRVNNMVTMGPTENFFGLGQNNNTTPRLFNEPTATEETQQGPSFGERAGEFVDDNLNSALRMLPIARNLLSRGPEAEVTSFGRLDNRFQEARIDEANLINRISNAAGNTRRALSEASGGNMGALSANLQQAGLNEMRAVSDANFQNQNFRAQQNQIGQEFDRQTDIRNLDIGMQETIANEQNRAAAQNAQDAMRNAAFEDIGLLGREGFMADVLRETTGYNPDGTKTNPMGLFQSLFNRENKYGGEVKRMKNYIKKKYGGKQV